MFQWRCNILVHFNFFFPNIEMLSHFAYFISHRERLCRSSTVSWVRKCGSVCATSGFGTGRVRCRAGVGLRVRAVERLECRPPWRTGSDPRVPTCPITVDAQKHCAIAGATVVAAWAEGHCQYLCPLCTVGAGARACAASVDKGAAEAVSG